LFKKGKHLIAAIAGSTSHLSEASFHKSKRYNVVKLSVALVIACSFQSSHAEDYALTGGRSGFSAAGTTGASTTATVNKLEFERKLSDLTTLTIGAGRLSYRATISTSTRQYQEDGSGTSLFVDWNFYPEKKTLNGFYVGPGVGITPVTNHWTDNRSGIKTSGGNSASVFDIHGKLGWKFNSDKLIIDPNARLGYFLNSPDSGAANLGLYLLIGINVGVMF
jgi:hypothetical protein